MYQKPRRTPWTNTEKSKYSKLHSICFHSPPPWSRAPVHIPSHIDCGSLYGKLSHFCNQCNAKRASDNNESRKEKIAYTHASHAERTSSSTRTAYVRQCWLLNESTRHERDTQIFFIYFHVVLELGWLTHAVWCVCVRINDSGDSYDRQKSHLRVAKTRAGILQNGFFSRVFGFARLSVCARSVCQCFAICKEVKCHSLSLSLTLSLLLLSRAHLTTTHGFKCRRWEILLVKNVI